MRFNSNNLVAALKKTGLKKNDTVYFSLNLAAAGFPETIKKKIRFLTHSGTYFIGSTFLIDDLRGNGPVYYVFNIDEYHRLDKNFNVISKGLFKEKNKVFTLKEDKLKFQWKISLKDKVVDIKSNFYKYSGFKRYHFKQPTKQQIKMVKQSVINFKEIKYAYDDSDDNLNRLHKLIMEDNFFLEKNKYLKYSKKGKFNGEKIKTMGLAVFIDYEKELSKLTKNIHLKEISPFPWGWDYSTEDQSHFADGWKAIRNCYQDVKKKKLSLRDGECILVDFRRITGDSQNPIISENYLIKERENKILIAKNIEESKKTKQQLADEKKEEEAKKKQLLLAQKKAEEERKKQEKVLAEKKKEEEKRKKELLLAQQEAEEDEKKKQELLLAQKKAEEERKKLEMLLAQKKAEEEKRIADAKKAEEKRLAEEKKKTKKKKVAKKPKKEFKPEDKDIDNDPPVILIAEAITVNDTSYEIEGKVTDKSKKVFIEIDGRPVRVKEGKFKVQRFSPVDEQITIVAIDQWGNKSEPKFVNITIDIQDTEVVEKLESLDPSNMRSKSNKNRVALIIGIEKYEQAPAANFANLDAKYFYEYAKRGFGISTSNMKLLVDEDANLIKSLGIISKWLPGKIKKNETELIVFFAGHGLASTDGEELYILMQDSDPDLLSRTALSRTELFKEIISLNPKSVTMFMDTCYSGVSRDEEILLASARPIRIVADEQEGVPDNFTIFTASQLDQISSGLKEANHGIFSYYLMKGLEGKADTDKDKQITNGELLAYMDQNVSQKASELGRQQNPSLAGDPDQVLMK